MKPEIVVILCIFLAFSVLEMLFNRFFNTPGQTRDDIIVEVVSADVFVASTQPLVRSSADKSPYSSY